MLTNCHILKLRKINSVFLLESGLCVIISEATQDLMLKGPILGLKIHHCLDIIVILNLYFCLIKEI